MLIAVCSATAARTRFRTAGYVRETRPHADARRARRREIGDVLDQGKTRADTGGQKKENVTLMEDQRVAIVTGASRGIGAAVAERLAGGGFAVVINYSGDRAPAEALVGKIEGGGGRALAARADVSRPDAARQRRNHLKE